MVLTSYGKLLREVRLTQKCVGIKKVIKSFTIMTHDRRQKFKIPLCEFTVMELFAERAFGGFVQTTSTPGKLNEVVV